MLVIMVKLWGRGYHPRVKALYLGAFTSLFPFVFPFFALSALFKEKVACQFCLSLPPLQQTRHPTTHTPFFCRKVINRGCRKMAYKGKTL